VISVEICSVSLCYSITQEAMDRFSGAGNDGIDSIGIVGLSQKLGDRYCRFLFLYEAEAAEITNHCDTDVVS